MSRARKKPKQRPKNRRKPQHRAIDREELEQIVERAKSSLSEEDHHKLKASMETLSFLTLELQAKGTSIKRLRNLLFGPSTEKTSAVVGGGSSGKGASKSEKKTSDESKKPRKGHGRNAASAYTGAEKETITHASLKAGDTCPKCEEGKAYRTSEPKVVVRITGMTPLHAVVYESERFRCNLCGTVFTAEIPVELGEEKYDETAASMIALLKYGCGVPFYRLERLQKGMGIPMPSSTQWEISERAADLLMPAHEELIRQAAQGEVLYNDDTVCKILDIAKRREQEKSEGKSDGRTGVFTTGIVSVGGKRQIAVFFSGGQHAGENLSDVLAQRSAELSVPIQMCDALSRNVPVDYETILASCTAHARRKFVDVAPNFPEQVRHVLEELGKVYHNDAVAREREMLSTDRLRFHQAESGPVMDRLEEWLNEQLDEHKVEPNSGLGEAIGYMLKHWDKLTLFLRQEGAPLDNNLCERILKRAILHRKNSLFYKTLHGARVGDIYMSLIHTCELNAINPFTYLTRLVREGERIAEDPRRWLPWNYESATTPAVCALICVYVSVILIRFACSWTRCSCACVT